MKTAFARFALKFARGHDVRTAPLRHRWAGWVFRNFPGQISCAQFEQFLMDYHEGSLPPGQAKLFEGHLALCGQCRASYQGYRTSIELGQRLFADTDGPLPDEVPDHMVAAVLDVLKAGEGNAR